MRKRLVIGAIAAVVIGVAAYMLSLPKTGSVEWHKREYLRAYDLTFHTTLKDRAVDYCRQVPGGAVVRRPPDARFARGVSTNWLALLKKGYVGIEIVYLTSRKSADVLRALPRQLTGTPADDKKLTSLGGGCLEGQQIIFVNAPTRDIPRWKDLIRKLDVAETE